jgi:hypothetical protein
VTDIGETRNVFKILNGNPDMNVPLGRLGGKMV